MEGEISMTQKEKTIWMGVVLFVIALIIVLAFVDLSQIEIGTPTPTP